MIRPKNEAEDLILPPTKYCETFIKETHTKPQEKLEYKPTRSRDFFSFAQPISIEGSWKIGLARLEVFNFIFNITEQNNNVELHKDNFDESSFATLKDAVEEIVNDSDIPPKDLKNDTRGPLISNVYRKFHLEKWSTVG